MSSPFSRRVRPARRGAVVTAAAALVAGTFAIVSSPAQAAESLSIAEIQGTGDTTPYAGQSVTTKGVVTAAYPKGGFDGFYLQTAGTGGGDPADQTASDAIFVYAADNPVNVEVGDHVEVTGEATEYKGLTEINQAADGVTVLDEPAEAVKPAEIAYPTTEEAREAYEGMLLAPQGDFTVSDNYDTNFFGEFTLAAGTTPLQQPTDGAKPSSDEAAAIEADNAARSVGLDDGSSINFNNGDNKNTPLPYLKSSKTQVRTGAPVTFDAPVVLDWRYDTWRFQPTTQLTATNDDAVNPVTFGKTREPRPADVGGSVRLATFNVLNYFTTTGDRLDGCTYYRDREGNPISVSGGCDARGAANKENLDRQQVKIVKAIDRLDADIVTLEEIENSAAFGKDRDAALARLTDALNEAAGEKRWTFVPSPETIPADEDVIRTAMIYRKSVVRAIGESAILDDPAFANARPPLAQTFRERGGARDDTFVVIANHFKSKGGDGTGDNEDTGDGQGAFNGDRVRQAEALVAFADERSEAARTSSVLLTGDFNAYTQEDPMQVFYDAGYIDLASRTGKSTYVYDGLVGSLDHVLASETAAEGVAGVDVWNANSVEPVAYEYSRYNYNATKLYDESPFRSSDHDPIVVGIDPDAKFVDLNLLNINDFHGRIEEDSTVQFAGTIEQLREQAGEDSTVFLSAGDNIGASLFASSVAKDQPTIDVLNALGLKSSAVGNHEFDKGFADLTDRVIGPDDDPNADWSYLGANVYEKGTTTPALDEYDVINVNGLRVAVVGTVTQETPSLVTPDGIKDLTFGDPVQAVNRVAKEIEADDAADVIVAEYHEGASEGTPDGATLDEELAKGGAFAKIVNKTSPAVDAIFTGHTHKQYAWDAPVPGEEGKTRPIVQTGSYGENIGQIELTVNAYNGDIDAYDAGNVARTTEDPGALIDKYDRVAEVDKIVADALEKAAEVGDQEIGSITADITTAFKGGDRDDRASESTLGDTVANMLRDTLADKDRGGAEIGVTNPGGLRDELLYAKSGPEGKDGIIRYAEANSVLPFTNNLNTITLTGKQFTTLLEQQWQTNPGGDAPERPYLQLGLSDNVSYTYKKKAKQGQHITSVTVDGKPIKPKKAYRIGTFSFLTAGGDNFRIFTKGKNLADSGLVDRDGWIEYIKSNSPLSPSFARRSVQAQGLPKTVRRTKKVTFTLRELNLTSKGSPSNKQAVVRLGSKKVGTAKVTAKGVAKVTFRVPKKAKLGSAQIRVQVKPSGTVVRIPVRVKKKG
ncbi:ExeM/NucH family extracellular endonuclease [Nocardioidaceae bacterium SCSIO 66511]|nr:ExeM/NucH family extracellular endonuclease [Nocardioidaceae bacterium SCSIO 66511]